ncbi:hypothetical protein COV16_02885 [Candidatus Woesearchaeota archaeon CG10_big_fil_rev_8_21_14_0_10_34_8]|nr:MAG: hypothetical protein COV16_02885 [Candidatus Woesearchaeota archaeon CG10_big_fil_rev_8_21_14_0_10_34_8]
MISTNLAEILGLLASEGSHVISYSSYWEKYRGKFRYRKNKKQERIEFYNKDKKLLFHYKNLIDSEFNISSRITKHGKINLGRKEVIKTIIEHTELGHLFWYVPKSVIKGNREIKLAFLKGFFDGDGSAVKSGARFFSTNKKGISQISRLLSDLKFTHNMQKPLIKKNRKPLYCIQLTSKDSKRFIRIIKPISKQSKQTL